jgi:hypothetical protein
METDPDFDVSKLTNEELYQSLDLTPSVTNGELDARIRELIRIYSHDEKLQKYFLDIWDHFFSQEEDNTVDNTYKATNEPKQEVSLTKQESVVKDGVLNPLLNQTRRIPLLVDSQQRDRHYQSSTNYIGSLSNTIKNVNSLKLYSYNIPYSWYTINNDYGSNFFLLQATSPGLDNGNHDYTIDISAGNYTAASLVSAVHDSIVRTKEINTDICFGITDISYNTSTLLSTLTVDMTKRFTETSYATYFPDFTNPITDPSRNSSIPNFLGYDQQTIPINEITGNKQALPYKAATASYDTNSAVYVIDTSNNTFNICQYTPTFLFDSDGYPYPSSLADSSLSHVIQTIPITVPQGTYTRNQLTTAVSQLLSTNLYLFDSSLSRVDRIDASFSYFDMTLTLNQFTTVNSQSAKIAVQFPPETTSPPIWTGNTSCFCFDNSFTEVSDLIAVTPLPLVSYDLSQSATMYLQCDQSGYDLSINDYTITVPDSPSIGYTLNDYIAAINQGITTANLASSGELNQTVFIVTPDTTAQMTIDINKIFSTAKYEIDFSNSVLYEFFAMTYNGTDLSGNLPTNSPYQGQITFSSKYFIPTDASYNTVPLCVVTPQPGFGNSNADPFIVPFTYSVPPAYIDPSNNLTYTDVYTIVTDVNKSFTQFQDAFGDNPLVGSQMVADISGSQLIVYLTMNVQKIITQTSYIATLYDASGSAPYSWEKYLNFDQSAYDLGDPIYDVSGQPYSQFDGSGALVNNIITLYDNVNNFFYFNPLSSADGLYTSIAGSYVNSHYNDIRITIPASVSGTAYTSTSQLITAMNKQFTTGDNWLYTYGTHIEEITIGGQPYAKLRVNLDRVFTSSDYALVFFNTTNFVKCYLGDANIRNAVWDTTLGWVLGFQQQTALPLSQYLINSTTAVVTGNTAININLYNCLLLSLDDFNQSRLNDGVITLLPNDTSLPLPSYSSQSNYTCDLSGNPISTGSTNVATNNLTLNQTYALNQILNSQLSQPKLITTGPYVQNIFAVIPLKTAGLQPGQPLVEMGGQLQQQERIYFGPVDISKLSVKLYNDKGTILDLNNTDWSFVILVEYLYQKNKT